MKQLSLDTYQTQAFLTAIYPNSGELLGRLYVAMGLANEAGEVLGKFKKSLRDHNGQISPQLRSAILGELGDVLWYCAVLCTELDASLEEVADANLKKLASRQERGVLGGDGDNR